MIRGMTWAEHIKQKQKIKSPSKKEVWWWNWCDCHYNVNEHVKLEGPIPHIEYMNIVWNNAESYWKSIRSPSYKKE
jgi:hypothetical protein